MTKKPNNRWEYFGRPDDDSDGSIDDEPTIDALRRAHEDSKHVLSEHLNVFSEQAEKAGRMARINGVVLTIFVYTAASSQTSNFLDFINCMSIPGIGLVFAGSGLALREQISQSVDAGVSSRELEILEDYKMNEKEYLRWILETGYSDWIDEAAESTESKANRVLVSILLSVGGILLLFAGIFIASS